MEQAITTTESDYDIDAFLEKRTEFIKKVNAIMQEKQDFHIIQGKKSLGKGGAEKIASIFGWQAEFIADQDTLKMFGNVTGLVAYICNLTKNKEFVGQGRGTASIGKNQNDPNKTVKMSQKSAFVDAVLRSSGLSDFFTQDIEDMDLEQKQAFTPKPTNVSSLPKTSPVAPPAASSGIVNVTLERRPKEELRGYFEGKISSAKTLGDLDIIGKAIGLSQDLSASEKALLRGKYKNRKDILTPISNEITEEDLRGAGL